ncbi:MAG: hypothetical protein KC931_25415, partial [Candidatus Omnitrophica bacterium]|nr:hypothetical protein [Candidatus Omnitrophota bacterium]
MNESGAPVSGPSAQVLEDLEIVRRALRHHLPADAKPRAVYLSGGFARGESGHYSHNGRSLPFGDYDVDVVVPRPLLELEKQSVFDDLEEQLSYRSVNSPSEPTLVADARVHNVLDLRFKTPEEFHVRPPDLAYYDFLQGHRLLEGEDLVKGMKPLEQWEISLISPWRILGNRLILCLKHVDTDFLERDPTPHETLAFRLARCRLYLDLAGLLVFLLGEYRTRYDERIEVLRNSKGLWRGWIEKPEVFIDRLEKIRQFKLNPSLEQITGPALFSEWFQTAKDVGQMMPHLINLILLSKQTPTEKIFEIMNKPAGTGGAAPPTIDPFAVDWSPLVARQFRSYPSLFYRDFIDHYIRRSGRKLPAAKTLASLASRYYGSYENATWRGRKWV